MLQKDGMDDALRNRLWQVVDAFLSIFLPVGDYEKFIRPTPRRRGWRRIRLWPFGDKEERARRLRDHDSLDWQDVTELWDKHWKLPTDTMPVRPDDVGREIRKRFFECAWYEVYDLLEFLTAHLPDGDAEGFASACNEVLEEEKAAYRIIGKTVSGIIEEHEIAAVEHALEESERLPGVRSHLQRALELFSDRKQPDYRNSVKEAISAVEALARLLARDEKATLGDALKALGSRGGVQAHPALRQAFEKLYGYTSDEDGIRHAMLDEGQVGQAEAQYMLVACSAFVSYLIAKAAEAGVGVS